MNRATADNQSAQSEEEGVEPTKEWVKDLIDEIVAEGIEAWPGISSCISSTRTKAIPRRYWKAA